MKYNYSVITLETIFRQRNLSLGFCKDKAYPVFI